PAILADLAIGWLVWSMILELGGRRGVALTAAAVGVLNPISWFDSVVWGQVDSVGVAFLLLGVRSMWRDQPERAAFFAVIAALIKPQLGILIPILAVVTIRRALWPVADEASEGAPDVRPGGGLWQRFLDWERHTDHPIRIVTTGLVALATTVLLCLPFGLSVIEFSSKAPYVGSGLLAQVFATASGYPYLSVNAFNPWAVILGDTGYSLANSGVWVCDGPWDAATCGSGVATFGPIPAVLVGSLLMLAVVAVVSLVAARRPDRLTILLSLTVLAIAFYVVPTRVHERYAYPAFALTLILATISWRWRATYLVFSVTVFLNMYAALTKPFYNNPGIQDWLGIGDVLRSEPGVAIIAVLNVLVFLWAIAQVRAAARSRLADDLERERALAAEADGQWSLAAQNAALGTAHVASTAFMAAAAATASGTVVTPILEHSSPARTAAPGLGGSGATAAVLPTWSSRPTFEEVGIRGWFKARLNEPPIRPDRSASLRSEGGGRLDKLDLFLVVILILGTLLLRTFRLAEPYQMHFDEVYHARTATEFLQSWRYGLSHDIYEWTHPHLAKYFMAAGLVAFGRDAVSATSDLGVPVRAAAIEPRRIDESAPGKRAGERLHIATGTEIRTYDLTTRDLISVLPAPGAGALAIDSNATHLVIGYDDGRIATIELALIDTESAAIGLEPVVLATVDHPVEHLLATADGTQIAAASAERLTTVAFDSGAVLGSIDLPGIVDLANGGSGAALVAEVGADTAPSALASDIAAILKTKASDYESILASASPGTTVTLGDPGTGAERTELDRAIADGTLPGVSVDTIPRIAVANQAGVVFVDPAGASVISTVDLTGGAHGLALVTGIDDTKLYATSGGPTDPAYHVIAVAGDAAKAGPADLGSHPLPGLGSSIIYDDASQMVHILGLAPKSASETGAAAGDVATVYVVEPHANAVFADAKLP
ncbi:MAG: hypothetical protein ABI562_08400, partial [Chloroflexota bacterium]